MIAESWEKGDFDTGFLEDQYTEERITYFEPKIYGKGGMR
jgi:hypothetical protein